MSTNGCCRGLPAKVCLRMSEENDPNSCSYVPPKPAMEDRAAEIRRLRMAINDHLAVIDKYPNATRSLDVLEQSIAGLRAAATNKF